MKKLIVALVFMLMTTLAFGADFAEARGGGRSGGRSHSSSGRPKTVHVRSYVKKDGTYVQSHMRAAPQR